MEFKKKLSKVKIIVYNYMVNIYLIINVLRGTDNFIKSINNR